MALNFLQKLFFRVGKEFITIDLPESSNKIADCIIVNGFATA